MSDADLFDDEVAPQIRDVVTGTSLREGSSIESIKRRGITRRRRRRMARVGVGAAAASVLTLGVLVVIDSTDDSTDFDVLAVEDSGGEWTWSEHDSLVSRDGTTSGVSVRRNEDSPDLLVYLRPGPVCLDDASCAEHPPSYVESDHERDTAPHGELNSGTLDPESGYFKDWTVVAVPNANGDLHLGNVNTENAAPGRAHVGRRNARQVIRAVMRDADEHSVERIVIAGSGSGGFAVYRAFDLVGESFDDLDVIGLVDSAPFPPARGMPSACLLRHWTNAWNLDLPRDFRAQIDGPLGLSHYYGFLTDRHPDRRFGIVIASDDEFGRELFGRGRQRCTVTDQPVSGETWNDAMSGVASTAADAGWQVLDHSGRENVITRDLDPAGRVELDTWLDELMENQP